MVQRSPSEGVVPVVYCKQQWIWNVEVQQQEGLASVSAESLLRSPVWFPRDGLSHVNANTICRGCERHRCQIMTEALHSSLELFE